MYYCEYCLQPYQRNATMIPVSSLPNFYTQDDAGYSSYYWFTEADAEIIRQQKRSKDMSRFSVYTKYLVLDIDREDNIALAKADMEKYCADIVRMGLKHSVWLSGGKGYHVYIHCEPMEGIDVPYSQLQWVKEQGWRVDLSLYQHGRLLSNPGRKSVKTGIRKHLLQSIDGSLLYVPRRTPPPRMAVSETVDKSDLARIAFFRSSKALEESPSSRHTQIWSLAGAFAEAGCPKHTTIEIIRFINSQWMEPKEDKGLIRAVDQAYEQTRTSPLQSPTKVAGPTPTSEGWSEERSADFFSVGLGVLRHSQLPELKSLEQQPRESQPNAPGSGIAAKLAGYSAKAK